MEKYLKQSLGIDVSKLNLSLSLGSLNKKLVKEFKSRPDVSNDLKGYKVLLKWLKASVDSDGGIVGSDGSYGSISPRYRPLLYTNRAMRSV